MGNKQPSNKFGGGVAALQPDNLGWETVDQATFVEIRIFGDDGETVVGRVLLDSRIACLSHT